MRALRWHGRGDVRLEDVDEPHAPSAGEVTVAVEWCGICGTDVEEYRFGPVVIPTEPHPLTGYAAPVVIGHEVSARVVEAGAGTTLAVGTLVALDGYYSCGRCSACLRHEVNLCVTWGHLGMSAPGGLAERITVPERMALPATADVPSDELALAEPFSVAVRACRRGRVGRGTRVAVVGAGTVGLALLQVARASGSGDVAVVDPSPTRRRRAEELGAVRAFASVVDALGSGWQHHADVAVDCTGSTEAPGALLDLLRSGGRGVVVGIPVEDCVVDVQQLVLRELSLVGSIGHVYDEDFATAVDLVCSRQVDAGALITHRLALEETVGAGFGLLTGPDRDQALKVLVSPRQSHLDG